MPDGLQLDDYIVEGVSPGFGSGNCINSSPRSPVNTTPPHRFLRLFFCFGPILEPQTNAIEAKREPIIRAGVTKRIRVSLIPASLHG